MHGPIPTAAVDAQLIIQVQHVEPTLSDGRQGLPQPRPQSEHGRVVKGNLGAHARCFDPRNVP